MKSSNIVRVRGKASTLDELIIMGMGLMEPFELFYRIMGIPRIGIDAELIGTEMRIFLEKEDIQ